MYRYILFDLDGTLTDSREGIVHCVRETIESYGDVQPAEETLLRNEIAHNALRETQAGTEKENAGQEQGEAPRQEAEGDAEDEDDEKELGEA